MNPELESKILSDRRVWSKNLLLLAGLITFGFVGVAGYYIYQIQINTPRTSALPPLESFGLFDSAEVELPSLSGELVFNTTVIGDESTLPKLFEYSFSDDTQGVLLDLPVYSYQPLIDGSVLTLAYFEGTDDPDGWQPMVLNTLTNTVATIPGANAFNEIGLTASMDGTYYAYSGQKGAVYTDNITDWSVFIYRNDGELLAEIPGADSPEFTRDGQYVYYIKNDGLYRFATASGSSERLNTNYSNLSRVDDLALSPTGGNLLLTVPTRGVVAYFEVTKEGLVEISRMVKSDYWFRSPVFSPDGAFYAVLTGDIKVDSTDMINAVLEVYPVGVMESVKTIPVSDFDSINLTLESWTDSSLEISEAGYQLEQ